MSALGRVARRTGRVLLMGALAAIIAVPAAAQSLTSVRGLGYPLLPVDARTEVLGGLGIGLKGLSVPLINPAAAASIGRRGAVVSLAVAEQNASLGERSDASGATRFPLIRLVVPTRRVVFTAGYGGYLDQSWGLTRSGQGTASGNPVDFTDRVTSDGGIGQFQIGAAVPLGNRVAVGAAVGAYTGAQQVQFQRRFDPESTVPLQPFSETWEWQYTAPLAQLGVRWDPLDMLRIGASVTWAGTLTGDSAGGPARDVEYQLPMQVAGGVSGYLSPTLLATVSARWSGWSTVEDVASVAPGGVTATSRDTWEVGGGLEWDDPESRALRSFPLRIGGQYRQLPFTFVGDAPTEWFAGAGVGMRMGDVDNPLARLDLAVQRGERSGLGNAEIGDFSESAWRVSFTVSVFGT